MCWWNKNIHSRTYTKGIKRHFMTQKYSFILFCNIIRYRRELELDLTVKLSLDIFSKNWSFFKQILQFIIWIRTKHEFINYHWKIVTWFSFGILPERADPRKFELDPAPGGSWSGKRIPWLKTKGKRLAIPRQRKTQNNLSFFNILFWTLFSLRMFRDWKT